MPHPATRAIFPLRGYSTDWGMHHAAVDLRESSTQRTDLKTKQARKGVPSAPELFIRSKFVFYCATGGGAGALGGFRWRALGGAGVPGGAGALGTTGAAGNAGPFLIRTSPLLELNTILALPDPIFPFTVLSSSPVTGKLYSVTMSPLCVRPSTVPDAFGGSVNSTSPLSFFASTL